MLNFISVIFRIYKMEFKALDNTGTVYLLLAIVGVWVWVFSKERNILSNKFRLLSSTFKAKHDFKSIEGKKNLNEFILQFLFAIELALVFHIAKGAYDVDFDVFVIAGLLLVALFLKSQFFKFIGFLTGKTIIFEFYKYNISLIYKLLSIISLPIIIMAYLSTTNIKIISLWILIIFFAIAVFIRVFKLMQLANKYVKFHKIYFFIYFCTLEILPNWLIIELIFDKI